MFCIKCGTRLADGAAFCHSCGADLAAGAVADGPSASSGRRPASWLAMAAVVLAVGGAGLVGGLFLGRSDDGNGKGVAALPSTSTTVADASSATTAPLVEATPTVSVASPEDVARRWVQAQIDGDTTGYLELVRPDQVESFTSMDRLQGCDLQSAEVLVEEESSSEVTVTVLFSSPCGTSNVSGEGPTVNPGGRMSAALSTSLS